MELNKLSNEAYNAYVQSKAKPSPMGKNMVWAFLVGGLICVIGQGLLDWYQTMGLSRELAGTAVSVTLIFLTALLTGIGVFDSFAKHAGAGTLVPITGFANAVVAPAMEFKQEGLVTGTAAKLFTVAGPVLVYGISASVLYGLILWLIRFCKKTARAFPGTGSLLYGACLRRTSGLPGCCGSVCPKAMGDWMGSDRFKKEDPGRRGPARRPWPR
ncbi:MAG: stage V sporulation protein AC [Evtepia gabavorous]